ncbi:MAG: hypothetical protein PHW34_08405 [Hespellia sp.]|nr:hypothetical protein [Hespellia sp.]
MGNTGTIAIQNSLLSTQLNGISGAQTALDANASPVEVTGEVPAMKEFIETYERVAKTLGNYKMLLTRDIQNIQGAVKQIQQKEAEIAQSIK